MSTLDTYRLRPGARRIDAELYGPGRGGAIRPESTEPPEPPRPYLPCPDCARAGHPGRIGSRRTDCTSCNRFAAAVRAEERRRIVATLTSRRVQRIRAEAEAAVFSRQHPDATTTVEEAHR